METRGHLPKDCRAPTRGLAGTNPRTDTRSYFLTWAAWTSFTHHNALACGQDGVTPLAHEYAVGWIVLFISQSTGRRTKGNLQGAMRSSSTVHPEAGRLRREEVRVDRSRRRVSSSMKPTTKRRSYHSWKSCASHPPTVGKRGSTIWPNLWSVKVAPQ